jgi:hypothetical protein
MQGISYSGCDVVDFETLKEMPTPEGTHTHRPIPHWLLVAETEQAFSRQAKLSIKEETHTLSIDGNRYFGLLELQNGFHSDYALMVGLRNSHDKAFAAGLACGAQVFVCSNLSFSGDVVIGRKHTVNILDDLPVLIDDAVERICDLADRQKERFDAYKNHEMENSKADALLIEMLRRRILTGSQIPKVLKEWDEPSHQEFAGSRNCWRMFNAVTEVIRPRSQNQMVNLSARTRALHGLLDEVAGID